MSNLLSSNQPVPSPTAAYQAALRDLYRAARLIPHHTPYAAARLARIADQAEYFLHQWPTELWPTYSRSDSPIPDKDVLMNWLSSAKREAEYHQDAASAPLTYASWRQVTTPLLAALVPFN
ncbi:hypothetical protein [Hymenobacter norwichensis]|uniref:hypothetical protein n=1 Tax=Hymenobacter norwichensis TaxID=223903 RepID=UPI0003B57445|nr:hypothetical protein [Hymenobacter norwichensis]